ncbi:alkylation response protein AidB-like acyl-CoA dehydrogenase [Tamaricihabitans halophyticus]|uniref:Alkylation response protein AidB-like acyl-CoA dehydrogenase n=1 Tax=Tamaricihabitans halophyticus TaxID=1262583 RepID=A0A4R2Q2Q3_9PSEU|nr:acyl-CoA dehydrogenase family protein [Tamaricihabitans halophyticus]TCP42054.1 alkylation response protein AidB-like acyl-CoA dehydrogenase [Tamaricihabitans halophyticus]
MTDVVDRSDFVQSLREFAKRECGTKEQRDRLSSDGQVTHNQELYDKVVELGWAGCGIPTEYGGGGGSASDVCALVEEMSYGLAPLYGMVITLVSATVVERFGNEDQKRDILGGVTRGDVLATAISEPSSGSDPGSMICRAERDGDNYVINGQKTWISCAHIAKRIQVLCRTDDSGSKHDGITMIDVPAEAEGLTIRPIRTLGGDEVNEVYFDNVTVGADRVIGDPGKAWQQIMRTLNTDRLMCGAMFLGRARRIFDDTVEYVRTREQFGRPIGSFQAIRHRIADLATELECCRLLVRDLAAKLDADPERCEPREASMVKLKVTETAKRMAIEGMQLLGGAGYTKDHDMELHLRESIVSTVYAGTSEIQREIIGKSYGL